MVFTQEMNECVETRGDCEQRTIKHIQDTTVQCHAAAWP